MSVGDAVESLHLKCSKLDSNELILLIAQVALERPANIDRILKILKVYLVRALQLEGFK